MSHAFLCREDEKFVFFFPSLPFPPSLIPPSTFFNCLSSLFVLARLLNVGNVVELFMLEEEKPRSVVFMG